MHQAKEDVEIREVPAQRREFQPQKSQKGQKGQERRKFLDKYLKCVANDIMETDIKEEEIVKKLECIQVHFERAKQDEFGGKDIDHPLLDFTHAGDDCVENSLLHLAVIHDRDEVARKLLEMAPNLACKQRNADDYHGQTPFHIAIAKDNLFIVKQMIDADEKDGIRDLMNISAVGNGLLGTVMMGELPLSIAALNGNEKMLDLLIEKHADPTAKNSKGNTIIHTIVLWGYYNSSSSTQKHCQEILKKVQDAITNDRFRSLILLDNNNGFTPLQLSAKTGQPSLFDYMMNLEGIYRYPDQNWTLDGIYRADVTDLDRTRWLEELESRQQKETTMKRHTNGELHQDLQWWRSCIQRYNKYSNESGLEAIFHGPVDKAEEFMANDVIKELIYQKWKRYKWIYYPLGILHIFYMLFLTSESVFRLYIYKRRPFREDGLLQLLYVNGVTGLSFILGLLYATQEIFRTFIFWQSLSWGKFHHNFIYRISFFLFGIMLIIDSVWNLATYQTNNYFLYLALWLGWFSSLFFMRAHYFMTFYTYMFLTSVFGEVLFFVPVMIPLIITFPVAMHETSLSKRDTMYVCTSNTYICDSLDTDIACSNCTCSVEGNIPGFNSFQESLFTLFQWISGLGEITNVHEGHDKTAFAVVTFVLFIILGNIILMNILVAVLTTRDDLKNINRGLFATLQKLSLIIYMEVLLGPLCVSCGETDRSIRHHKSHHTRRYLMQVIHHRVTTENTGPVPLKSLLWQIGNE